MANESLLWTWMHAEAKRFPDLHMNRIENMVGNGFPDVELCHAGATAWIELKGLDRPIRAQTLLRIKFQPGQPEWAERRWNCGGSSWVYVRVGKGQGAIARYLVPGSSARLLAYPLLEADLAKLSALPRAHSFKDLLLAIRR